jgi:hypothetical protein
MKNLIIICFLFLSSIHFAQELQFNKGKFYLGENRISDSQAKEILSLHEPSKVLFEEAKSKGVVGGLMLGFGMGLVLTDIIQGGYKYNYDYPQSITFIGLGAVVISIPILAGRRKKLQKSVDLYLENVQSLKNATGSNYELKFISNQNGTGFQLLF